MLDRYLILLPAIHAAATDDRIKGSLKGKIPNEAEETLLEKVVKVLQPMKEFTLVVSADKSPTLNVVLPSLKKIKIQLTSDTNSDEEPAAIRKNENGHVGEPGEKEQEGIRDDANSQLHGSKAEDPCIPSARREAGCP